MKEVKEVVCAWIASCITPQQAITVRQFCLTKKQQTGIPDWGALADIALERADEIIQSDALTKMITP